MKGAIGPSYFDIRLFIFPPKKWVPSNTFVHISEADLKVVRCNHSGVGFRII